MATLANLFDRILGAGSVAEVDEPYVRADADEFYKLRALPNEDVYFFVKRIDNSRVVRKSDPREQRKSWTFVGGACAAAFTLICMLLPSVYGLMAGYQLSALQQERSRLVAERATLEIEEARLLSSQHLEHLAVTQKYIDPEPNRIVHLTPKAGSLALNRR